MTKRPWLVVGRSNEYEINGHVGRRFSTKEKADAFKQYAQDELCWWSIGVYYNPVPVSGATDTEKPPQR